MNWNKQRFSFVGVLVSLALGACASPPPLVAPEADDALAKAFTPPPGQAVIYVYRNGGYRGSLVPQLVTVNGREVAEIENKTFIRIDVDPGAHDVWGGREGHIGLAFAHINVIAGQKYFVRVGMTDPENEAVSSEKAREELLACCKLAAPRSVRRALPGLFR